MDGEIARKVSKRGIFFKLFWPCDWHTFRRRFFRIRVGAGNQKIKKNVASTARVEVFYLH